MPGFARSSAASLVVGILSTIPISACTPDFDPLDPSLGGSSSQGGNGGLGASGNGGSGNGAGGSGGDGPVCEPIVDGDDCTEDICQNGVPANPQKAPGASCNQSGGSVCDENGDCIGCFADEHCTLPDTCGGGGVEEVCGCTPTTCLALGATCGMVPDGCGGMLNCDNGAMDGTETAIDCGGDLGTCATRCDVGQACDDANDCTGDFCADGFCCSTACNQTCRSCGLATQEGTCVFVPLQEEDPDSCVAPDACSGDGVCKLANGQPCNGNGACASGNCDIGGTDTCIP